MLKKFASKAAADESTGGVTFSPVRPELLPQFCPMGYVEDAFEVRTKHGKRRVLARRGWAGETSDFFNIRLDGYVSRAVVGRSRLVG